MPLDPSIYQRLGQQNTLGQLAGSINQYTENQGRLADLARQRQMQDVQMQRQEQQWQAQQAATAQATKEKSIQKSSLELANMIRSGAPRDQVESWAVQRYSELGLPTDQLKQKLDGVYAAPAGVTGQADLMEESAFPEIAAKQRMEQRFSTQKPQSESALATLMAEREKIAAQNPNAPQLAIYDQMIQKQTTHTPFMQVATGAGNEQYMVTAPKAGGKATVQPLGIAKPITSGEGAEKPMTEMDKTKFREVWSKDYKELQGAISSANDIALQSAKVKNNPGLKGITGLSGYVGDIPGGSASSARADFETLKGKVTSMGKALMSASGSIGTMANAEWKIVSDAVAAIDPTKMDEKKLREQIELIEAQSTGMVDRLNDAYGRQYGPYYEKFPEFKPKETNIKPVTPKATKTGATQPADSEAVAWAKANPTDPRSAKILQLQR